jgi:hypothetical protein
MNSPIATPGLAPSIPEPALPPRLIGIFCDTSVAGALCEAFLNDGWERLNLFENLLHAFAQDADPRNPFALVSRFHAKKSGTSIVLIQYNSLPTPLSVTSPLLNHCKDLFIKNAGAMLCDAIFVVGGSLQPCSKCCGQKEQDCDPVRHQLGLSPILQANCSVFCSCTFIFLTRLHLNGNPTQSWRPPFKRSLTTMYGSTIVRAIACPTRTT